MSGFMAHQKPGYVSTMIFYMMVCLLLAEILMLIVSYQIFRVTQHLDRRQFMKGDRLAYELLVVNPSIFLLVPMTISYTGSKEIFKGSGLGDEADLMLYPMNGERIQKEIRCDYRGNYYVGVERIVLRSFFGMFSWDYTGCEMMKILVYPTIYSFAGGRFSYALSELSESIVSFDRQDKSVFSELREYQPGDSLSRIHWKMSAARDALITKSYEGNLSNKTQLYINTVSHHYDYESNVLIEDYLVEGAVALSKFLLENNTVTELCWYDQGAEKVIGNHAKDFQRFYDAFANMRFSADTTDLIRQMRDESKRTSNPCVMVIFTSLITPALSEVLTILGSRGYQINLVTPVLKNDEMTLEALSPVFGLMDQGIRVYHMRFEDGICRMEVA